MVLENSKMQTMIAICIFIHKFLFLLLLLVYAVVYFVVLFLLGTTTLTFIMLLLVLLLVLLPGEQRLFESTNISDLSSSLIKKSGLAPFSNIHSLDLNGPKFRVELLMIF